MSKRNYYSLLVKEDGRWTIQFGDYDRKVVQQEVADEYSGVTTKIITTNPDQASIVAAVAALNGDE